MVMHLICDQDIISDQDIIRKAFFFLNYIKSWDLSYVKKYSIPGKIIFYYWEMFLLIGRNAKLLFTHVFSLAC